MITASLTPSGTVALKPRTRVDLERLEALPYVRIKGRVGATFWTYLRDLTRDLSGRLDFDDSVVRELRTLKAAVESRASGDDTAVRSLFAPDRQPYGFQVEGIHTGVSVERLLIADDTGLGKTIQTMGILFYLMSLGLVKRAMLVVPAGLKHQWAEEIDSFAADPPHVRIVMPGSKKKRRQIYNGRWDVLLVNPELLRNDVRMLRKVCADVDFVALDEASMIRNSESKISKVMKYLFKQTRYRLALTATPVENRLADLFSVFEWLDPRVFLSRAYFDDRYVVFKVKKFMIYSPRWKKKVRVVKKVPLRYRNLREVHAKIKPFYMRRRVSDPNVEKELPSLIVQWEKLTLPKRQREVYDAVKDKVEEKLTGLRGAAMRAPLQALRQVCDSTALVEKKGAKKKPVSVKLDRVVELLETELAGEQVLIFTDFERFARLTAQALRQYKPVLYTGKMNKTERQHAIDAFKAGTRQVLIGTRALERGHNLQNAGVIINADLPFNPAAVKQRLGRILRFGSKHKVARMINLICEDTVEERMILKRLYEKRETFEDIFGADELTAADPIESMLPADLKGLL